MKHIFLLFFVFASLAGFSEAGILLVEGKYQNKNVFVQNGFNNSGVGFCAYEVKVNGQVTSDEVNSSAFEVDLAPYKFSIGDKVSIEIRHKDGCIPKVLNPEVLKPKPTFDILDLTVSNEGILNWTSKNEMGSLPYVVEQYKWNKWVFVGEVNGQGTPATHSYSFKIIPHSGENKFRLKQTGFGSAPRYSNPVTFNSLMEKPGFQIAKDSKSITFSSETSYEVYDFYGNVVKKGYANNLDISNLNKGKYYLCFDTVVTEIEKRR
ncbi:MAG: hypothetical protein K0S33_298 [Bacteroidetes bacterium]|jgi:hypothetical protein|nr:hypothetical protein [Bacteroidota bacterium]